MLAFGRLFKMELITSNMLRRNLPWKVWQYDHSHNIYVLIPRTCEYVLLHGKRDLEDI